MKKLRTIFTLIFTAIVSQASPVVTNAWQVDFDNNAPIVLNVWRGDIRALTAQTGLTSLTNDAMFYWQSADMQSLWYETNATVSASGDVSVTWDSGMDAGDPYYTFFFRAGGVYCPRGTIRMQGSPGAVPNYLPLPTLRIDFDLIETLNAPWTTPADVAAAFVPLDDGVGTASAFRAQADNGKYSLWGHTLLILFGSQYSNGINISSSGWNKLVTGNTEFSVGWPTRKDGSPIATLGDIDDAMIGIATTTWVESIRGIHTDIATNVVYHVVVSNGHWLIQEVQ